MPEEIKICGTVISIGDRKIDLKPVDECKEIYTPSTIEGFILALTVIGYKCITPEDDDCNVELVYKYTIPEVPVIS